MSKSHLHSGQFDRIPPHNLEAEMALIGSIFVDRDYFEVVARHVRASDFYAHVHEIIFETLAELVLENSALDKISVAERLRNKDQLEKVGGLSYLSSMMDTVQTAASAEYYAKIIREKSILRSLIHAGIQITKLGYEAEEDVDEAASQSVALIERIVEHTGVHVVKDAHHAMYDMVTLIDEGGMKLRKTQWESLNERIGGFARKEMNIWGANPGMGKSGAVMSLAHYAAMKGTPVVMACLEMGIRATMMRYAAMLSGIPTKKIREGSVNQTEFNAIVDATTQHFRELPIVMLDKHPAWSIAELIVALRKKKRELGDLGVVVLDHIGFLRDVNEGPPNLSRHERLDMAFKNLLALGNDLDCEMHIVQHMNRSAKDDVPTMFDLRDGGNPEGHAHNILIPWRPKPDSDIAEERAEGYFVIDKARDGETGLVPMKFWGGRSMWVDAQHAYPWWE